MAFLRRAQIRFERRTEVEALCADAESRTGVLKPRTVNLYRQYYRAALLKVAERQRLPPADVEHYGARIEAALKKLRGRPAEPRTSSKKVKNPTDWMVKSVFGRLKQQALHHKRVRLAATALYCLVQPILGARPIELLDAQIDGELLTVRNAKRTDGSRRRIDLSQVHPSHRMALVVLIEIVARDVGKLGYQRWLKILAETLARACEAASTQENPIPRLSPTSFRHTAISTWSAAGFSEGEIAEMAGHFSLLTARRHYIHAGAAWAVGGAGVIRAGAEPGQPRPPTEERSPGEAFAFQEFPTPPAKKVPEGPSGADLWEKYKEKQPWGIESNPRASSQPASPLPTTGRRPR